MTWHRKNRLGSVWANLPLRSKGLVVVAIPFTALSFTAVLSYVVELHQRKAQDLVRHTLEARARIQHVMTFMFEAETGKLGYLLTGRKKWLDPYLVDQNHLVEVIGNLRPFVDQSPAQLQRVAQIQALGKRKVAAMAGLVGQFARYGNTSAGSAGALAATKADMDEVRRLFMEMQREEDSVLSQQTEGLERINRAYFIAMSVSVLSGLSGGFAATLLLTSGVVRRVQHLEKNAHRLAQGLPLVPDSRSEDEIGRLGEELRNASSLLGKRALELGEVRAFLEYLIDFSPGVIFRGKLDKFTLSYVSPNVSRLLGVAPVELLGSANSWLEHIHPEDRDGFLGSIDRALEQKASRLEQEYRFRGKGGAYEWLYSVITLEHRAPEEGISAVGYLLDVTERKRGEQRMAVQHAVTRVLSESASFSAAAPQLVQVICEHLGWDMSEFSTVEPRSDGLRCAAKWRPCSAPIAEFEEVTRGMMFERGVGLPGKVWAEGAPLWFTDIHAGQVLLQKRSTAAADLRSAFGFPILVGGEVLGVMNFFSLDVRSPEPDLIRMVAAMGSQIGLSMERKRSEEALARQAGELARSEEAFRNQTRILQSVLDSMGDAVVVVDESGRFLLSNPAAEQMVGVRRLESNLAGWARRCELYLPDMTTLYPSHELPLTRAMQGESVDATEIFVRQSQEGEGVWVSVTARPLRNEEGGLRGGVAVFHNVTEMKAEERLRREKEEAERANRAKSEFLSRMSHELRTPLSAILGFGQLLEIEDLNERERESTGQILKAGRHLLALINDVLDISRIEAGRLAITPEPVSVVEVIRECLDLIRPLVSARGVSVNARWPEIGERHVQADPKRLKQVLLNLLSNAVKYNREGGQVTLACEDLTHDRLRIAVTDTGAGLPPDDIAKLFAPFERLDADQTGVEGTGLGLAFSKCLAEAMGGSIGVASVVGQGSTFWIDLPLAEATERLKSPEDEPAYAG